MSENQTRWEQLRRLFIVVLFAAVRFDDAATDRIEADQKQGLIPEFDARPVAFALNRLDAYTLVHAFGQRPRSRPEPVREALARVWISTLYGAEWVGKSASTLIRR